MKNHFSSRPRFTGLLVSGFALALPILAVQAQDETPAPPLQNGSNNRPNFRNMTPEQRQQMMQERMAESFKTTLTGAGFTEESLQNAIVEHAQAQDTAIAPLRERNQKFSQALSAGAVNDEQAAAALKTMRELVAAEKERRTTAAAALDEKIGYSKQPKLEALLTSMGLIGDEAAVLSGTTNTGGFGGGNNRGGRGGNNGGGNNN